MLPGVDAKCATTAKCFWEWPSMKGPDTAQLVREAPDDGRIGLNELGIA